MQQNLHVLTENQSWNKAKFANAHASCPLHNTLTCFYAVDNMWLFGQIFLQIKNCSKWFVSSDRLILNLPWSKNISARDSVLDLRPRTQFMSKVTRIEFWMGNRKQISNVGENNDTLLKIELHRIQNEYTLNKLLLNYFVE